MFDRLRNLFKRASPENPTTNLADPATWLWDALGARESSTGISVSPETSLEVSAVWAAVRVISSTIASLPLPVYRHIAGGKEVKRDHPAYRLLHDRPNPEQSSFVFREQMLAHLLLYGNSYAEIERNGKGDPIGLWPLHPRNVRIARLRDQKSYVVTVNGAHVSLSPDNVLHVPGFSLDGQQGLIPVSLGRNSIGLTSAAESFAAKFFKNGAAPSGVLTHPGTLGPEAANNLRTSWDASYSGLTNAQRVAILEEGMTWTPLGVAPEHAQMLETRKFQVSDVARLFQIPPHLIGDLERATFSNIEHMSIQFAQLCVSPWCKRIEQEVNYKLFTDPNVFAEFNLEGMLRGDSTTRASFYASALSSGWLSVNDVRARENLNAIDGGDEYLRPLNMQAIGDDNV